MASAAVKSVKASGGSLREFARTLRRFAGFENAAAANDARALLRSVDTGIASADSIIRGLEVTRSSAGYLRISNQTVGRISEIIHEGNLPELVRVSGRNVRYTAGDVRQFAAAMADTPQRSTFQMLNETTAAERARPHLNVTVENLNIISDVARQDLTKIKSNLLKRVKTGTVIALTVGVVYVGVDWLEKACRDANGCYMQTTINGRTTSCKVMAYSCGGTTVTQTGNLCAALPRDHYNVTLVLMKLSMLDDGDDLKKRLAQAVNVPVAEVYDRLGYIIDTEYEACARFVLGQMNDEQRAIADVCGLKHPQVEGGVVPYCRMCTPSASPTSTTYINPDMYADNITFRCQQNPSILQIITDASMSTGYDLYDGLKRTVSGSFAKVFWYALLVVVAVVVMGLAAKLLPKWMRTRAAARKEEAELRESLL